MNDLKSRMSDGHATRAFWLEAGSPIMAEAAIYAGMRFVLIDNEHGPASIETTAHMVRAIKAAGGHPMVRVAANDPVLLKRVMEIGLNSIMVPLVNTADEARAAVAACRYPPDGIRGFAGDIRASGFGTDPTYAQTANDGLFLMLQVESSEGVDNIEEIAAVEGVDMIFVGPYDLSGSYGKLGETNCPEVESAIQHVVIATNEAGLPLGTVPREGKSISDLLNGPFSLVVSGSEIGMAISAIQSDLSEHDARWL